MIWKHELNVDDANTAQTFKKEILDIDPEIVVQVTKNKSQWLVKSSVEGIRGGMNKLVIATRALKKLYDKYGDKIAYHNESVGKKTVLRKLVEQVIKGYKQ